MTDVKNEIPTDKEIWKEVDSRVAHLETIAPVFEKVKKSVITIPTRDELFATLKDFYNKQIEQNKVEEARKVAEETKLKEADEAYLNSRRNQGLAIITVQGFKKKHPSVKVDEIKNLSQEKLHIFFDFMESFDAARALSKKITRVKLLSRKLLLEYLSQAYGIYRSIQKSESASIIFRDMRAALQNKLGIKTHEDIPRASIVLKLVFDGASNKTINLYTRSFQLADGYDIDQNSFAMFVSELGGMEKIRKAYATVLAADRGKFRPLYVKRAEESASMNQMLSIEPNYVLQLTLPQASIFQNDILNRFCLIFARIDPMNQLEIYSQFPSDKQIVDKIIDRFTQVNKIKKNNEWNDTKRMIGLRTAKQLEEKMALAKKREQEKQATAEKKEASTAKKNATTAKRFAKQATNTVSSTAKTMTKVTAVKKTKK